MVDILCDEMKESVKVGNLPSLARRGRWKGETEGQAEMSVRNRQRGAAPHETFFYSLCPRSQSMKVVKPLPLPQRLRLLRRKVLLHPKQLLTVANKTI